MPLLVARTLRRFGVLTRDRLATAVALLLMAFAHPAAAQVTPEAKAGARAAALQGLDAFAAKDYAKTIDKFTRAESLMHAPTHLLMIARAQVALGRLVSARENYVALSRETLAPNAPPAFKEAQADGVKELQALEPRVPTIDVKVSDAAAKNLVITMDGAPFPIALVGIPHPVDPGAHVLQARGDGALSDEKSVKVDEGARVAVVLELRPAPGATGAVTPAPRTTPAADAPGPAPAPANGGMRIAGFVGIGLGVVGVGVGAVFTGLGFSTRADADDANAACPPPGCVKGTQPANDIDALDGDANTQQTIGLIGLLAGGVLAATGVTMLLLSPGADDWSHANLWVGPGSVGVRGTF